MQGLGVFVNRATNVEPSPLMLRAKELYEKADGRSLSECIAQAREEMREDDFVLQSAYCRAFGKEWIEKSFYDDLKTERDVLENALRDINLATNNALAVTEKGAPDGV